jgi:hypothetical protein
MSILPELYASDVSSTVVLSLVDGKDMSSVLVLRALATLFPRRTDYYPVTYISFENTDIFLSDLLYSFYVSALVVFSAAVRFSLLDRGLSALFRSWNLQNCSVSLSSGTLNLLGLSESFVSSPHLFCKLKQRHICSKVSRTTSPFTWLKCE